MKRRLGAVAIVLMALTALAGVLSYILWPKKDPQNSMAQNQAFEDPASSSSKTINLDPTEPFPVAQSLPLVAATPRADQPMRLKPQPPAQSLEWKLLDWSLKPLPSKPHTQLRAASYLTSGKYPFVRVEQEIQVDLNGDAKVLITKEMVGDQIIVKLPKGSSVEIINSLAAKLGGQAAAKPFAPDSWLVALPRKLEAVPEALEGSTNSGINIEYAEPNHLVRPMRTPNDLYMTNFSQWHLYNNSQTDKDIKAPRAWDRRFSGAYGSTNKVIVAVIDSGVNYNHEDLNANMWRNPGEIAGNGIDDDGNGLTDDVYGANYLGSNGDPIDPNDNSHGTHCAGLIGAVGNNGVGVTGVAWAGVQIMALRFINGTGSTTDEVKCIDYAIAKGAKVINASFGFPDNNGGSSTESSAIQRASNAGIILVAAAGNDGTNNDTNPFYPASYNRSNIIAVGATDRNDSRAIFNSTQSSNYGATSVDLMAPGVEMWSTTTSGTNNSSYNQGAGTSFAAPVVSGAVALLTAESPNDSVTTRKGKVVNTNAVDVLPSLSGLCVTGGRLNLAKLLPAADVATLPIALAWHRPGYAEPLLGSPMRTPTNAAFSNTLTFFSGVKKFNNTNGVNTSGLVNQTGGWLFYRTSSSVGWSSNSLTWHSNTNDYQFWKGVISNIPAGNYTYYLQLDFDSGARTTYSYYTNNADGFTTTTNQATAQASPYSFSVAKATATITIGGTNQTYNGSARSVSVSTTPLGLSNTVTYNGSSSAPTNAGSYTVVATVNDSNYEGSVTNTLSVAKANASVSLSSLSQTYDGSTRAVTATTSPTNLSVNTTYNGSSSAPTNAGSYTVVATVNDANYVGSATDTLTVAKATATVTLTGLTQTYNGSPKSVTVSTSPAGLNTTVTYNGSSSPPTDVGTYAVAVSISDPNYQGSGTATFTIQPAPVSFASTFGSATPTSDSDGDGIPALVEYALGGGTNGNDLSLLPVPSIAGSNVSMAAVVRTNDTNLLIYPQASLDLSSSNWLSSGFTTNTSNQTNVPVGFQRREYQFNAGTHPRAFLKLTIEQK